MQIIPAVNETDFSKIEEKIKKASEFSDWIQIDVADGKFTPNKTWQNPFSVSKPNIELHLMAEKPEEAVDGWLKTGVKRIIVHHEAVVDSAEKNPNFNNEIDILNFILAKCGTENIELGLAINPETPADSLVPHLDKIKFIQILAVNPGLAGQKFRPEILDKIKFLRSLGDMYLGPTIEVDGGIDLEIAKLCKEAGADILAAASYIWDNPEPKEAYRQLSEI